MNAMYTPPAHGQADGRAGLRRDLAQVRVVGHGHVEEAQAQRVVVRADERVHPHVVDVVVDDHEVAGGKPTFTLPAALVRIAMFTPIRPSTRMGNTTSWGVYPS